MKKLQMQLLSGIMAAVVLGAVPATDIISGEEVNAVYKERRGSAPSIDVL